MVDSQTILSMAGTGEGGEEVIYRGYVGLFARNDQDHVNQRKQIIDLYDATGISQFAAYPTVDMGLQLIELDAGGQGTSGPSGAGVALQQTAASSFSGSYSTNFTATVNYPGTTTGFETFAGSVSTKSSPNLTGTLDVDAFDNDLSSVVTSPASPLAGSRFTAGGNGRFSLSLTFTPASTVPPGSDIFTTLNPVCYLLDANTCLLLGTDSAAPGTGIMQVPQNLSF